MFQWYLKQRLSVKLVLPSILIIALLSIAGTFILFLAKQQQHLQKTTNIETQWAQKLSNLIESYNQVQSHLYKAVALSFAGQENSKIVKELEQYTSLQSDLENSMNEMAALKNFSLEKDLFKTFQDQSHLYFKWVREVADNIDDPGMAASNMITTETKFLLLRETLEKIMSAQKSRMINGVAKTEKSLNRLILWQILSIIIVAIVALGIALLNLGMFQSFVNKTKEDIAIIAGGNFGHRITVTSGDELGELAMSVEHMRENIHTLLGGLKTTASQLTNSSSTLRELSSQLTRDASTVGDRTNVISNAGREVSELSENLAREAQTVSSGSSSTSQSLDEMKSTIQEISKNCIVEVQMAQSSANTVDTVVKGMKELDEASKEIGGILKMINDIARKTGLLALNATIEAASAGAAGKGFAVVASEVKALAIQSESAAKQIAQKINAIQTRVANTIVATNEISSAIANFSGIAQTISAAVEEQTVTVSTIASAVADVSQSSRALVHGMEDVSSRSLQVLNAIKDVSEVVSSTVKEAQHTSDNSSTLNSMAEKLTATISQYKLHSDA